MKTLAMLMIIGSFLAGAFLSSLDPRSVNWLLMGPALAIGVAGLWAFRRAHHDEVRSGTRLAGNIQTLGDSLDNIHRNLEAVCGRGDDLPVSAMAADGTSSVAMPCQSAPTVTRPWSSARVRRWSARVRARNRPSVQRS